MKRSQSGFTLIELMIVIAIVGILASIAMPSYRDYVLKANATEAITLLNSLNKKAIEFYNVNGTWPMSTAEMAAFDASVSATETDYATDVVHSIHFNANHVAAGQGATWVRLQDGAFGPNARRHLRAVLTVQGGMIDIDWCDQSGSWATETDIGQYFGC